ncbi:MAG: 1-acyl-sn-glycerol-3-phosphate acyltransferase, partial [Bdellovibrionales bacterium]|nr:1-acyl-sn-glycerol-3-phosphate acyltransferase [Bdellovibrionales bacterium]
MNGPYIWACSHHNYFCDVVPGGFEAPSPPRFLGKHTVFVWPVKAFFEFCGGIPVVRPEDMNSAGGRSALNRSSFRAAIDALQKGWGIGIYPEGVSIVRPGLVTPLKAGVAKLALSAEEASGFRLGLKIFPVGLEYGSRPRVASGLWIRYGKPLHLADYRDIFEKDYAAAVQALMGDLTSEMKRVFPHFETDEELAMAKKLQVAGVIESRIELSRVLAGRRHDGSFLDGLRGRIREFESSTKSAGIPVAAWGHRRRFSLLGAGGKAWRALMVGIGSPLVVWDLVNNTLPEHLLRSFIGFLASDETEVMSLRFMLAPVVLPVVYALQFRVWRGFV